MGKIIRNDAAVENISSDAHKTLTNATARGGRWKELAEARLGSVCALFASIEGQLQSAEDAHAPNAAKVAALNIRADRTIGKVYDTVWNEVGRPGSDAALSVIFPEGAGCYTEGDTATQPTRMRILGQLLGAGIHPKLSAATAQACVAEIAAEADELEKAVEASQLTSEKVNVFARVRTALGKVLQAELSNLKRAYKIEGFSEAEIHTVIPDRPGKTKKVETKVEAAPPSVQP